MHDEKNLHNSTPKTPPDARVDRKVLDSMSAIELAEELERVYARLEERGEEDFDDPLADAYLEALERKAPTPPHPDVRTSWRELMEKTGRAGRRSTVKTALTAILVAAVLIGIAVLTAQAAGFDIFGKLARWTAETFGFTASAAPGEPDDAHTPPALQGMRTELEEYDVSITLLPSYWPDGYEEVLLRDVGDPESHNFFGAYGNKGKRIVLSYTVFFSGNNTTSFSKDDESLELYTHNKLKFYITTNDDKYVAIWNSDGMEGRVSGLESRDELIKILDSIGE